MTKSLYAVLNVAPDADPAVIEAAYKALMKKYHPDRLGGTGAGDERRAAEINEAFQILTTTPALEPISCVGQLMRRPRLSMQPSRPRVVAHAGRACSCCWSSAASSIISGRRRTGSGIRW
jgi:hypothetical protein